MTSSCEWASCAPQNLYELPADSRPIVRSSLFEFRSYQLHEWKHRALHDPAVEHALAHAVCCFKRNLKASRGYPHTCFVADTADHAVRLPSACEEGTNRHSCVCRVLDREHFYCDGRRVRGALPPECTGGAVGREIECERADRIVVRTNTVAFDVPTGCKILQPATSP